MIGQISHIETIESLTNYHFKKMEEGVAVLLDSNDVDVQTKPMMNHSFKSQAVLNPNTNKPYTHISLNFAIEDTMLLSDDLMREVTKEFLADLGYLEQPYMMVRHNDQEHPHVHIITTDVKNNGTKVNQNYEYYRIKDICRKLEEKHGFRIVSNFKQEKEKALEIVNQADYSNYLKTSLKDVMRLKPKRFSDVQTVLKEVYSIDTFVTKTKGGKKGVAFALVDENNKRYINEIGTIAIAGSKLSSGLSFNKINQAIQNNYNSAPKRYRYMLNYQSKLNEQLVHFDEINYKDFERFTGQSKLIIKDNKPSLLLDLKGGNMFNFNELKNLNQSKLNKNQTNLNLDISSENGINLRTKIYTEAIKAYASDVSKGMRTSYFMSSVMEKSVVADYLGDSYMMDIYSSYFNQEQLTELFELKDFDFEKLKEYFVEIESSVIAESKEVLNRFSELIGDSLNMEQFFTSKERNDFVGSSISNVCFQYFNYEEKLNKAEKLLYSYREVSFEQLMMFFNHFEHSNINDVLNDKFSGFVNERVVKNILNEKAKSNIKSSEYIEHFNDRGFKFSLHDKGNVTVQFLDFKPLILSKFNDYLKEELQNEKQQIIEKSLASIEFRISIDSKNWNKVNQLMEHGTAKEQYFINEDLEFKNFLENKTFKSAIDKELFSISTQLKLDYYSQLMPVIMEHKDAFVKQLGKVFKERGEEFNYNLIEKYLNEITEPLAIQNLKVVEENKMKNFVENTLRFKDSSSILALCGFKKSSIGVTEKNGMYHFNSSINQSLADKLKLDKSFMYDSGEFKKLVNSYLSNSSNETPYFIPVLEKFKEYINPKDFKELSNFAQNSYIEYYINELKGLPADERLDFLNSKGVQVQNLHDGTIQFKMLHFDTKILINQNEIPKMMLSLDRQINTFNTYNYVNQDDFMAHIRFHNHLEKGDYISGAFELKKSNITPFFAESDLIMHKENLGKAMNQLKNEPNYLGYLQDLMNVFNNQGEQTKDQHGKHKEKKKRKSKGIRR